MLSGAFDTPWKVWNRIGAWLAYPYVRVMFLLRGIPWGKGWSFYGAPVVQKHRRSVMTFGPGLQLRSRVRSNPLGIHHPVVLATLGPGAELRIGERFAMSGGSICVAERVTIGDGVAVGANSTIADTDFHPLRAELRAVRPNEGKTRPVVIEDDVFIGTDCLILKGVTIGRGSVIGAGSVVTASVPPGVVAAGNPARVVKEL
ncbi:MAG TPA: acyltransferase [Candidatus Bathyarchaeia archaeon]|nr:acyltransferase [Candidatus Bathyarchaeia archaeon]